MKSTRLTVKRGFYQYLGHQNAITRREDFDIFAVKAKIMHSNSTNQHADQQQTHSIVLQIMTQICKTDMKLKHYRKETSQGKRA